MDVTHKLTKTTKLGMFHAITNARMGYHLRSFDDWLISAVKTQRGWVVVYHVDMLDGTREQRCSLIVLKPGITVETTIIV